MIGLCSPWEQLKFCTWGGNNLFRKRCLHNKSIIIIEIITFPKKWWTYFVPFSLCGTWTACSEQLQSHIEFLANSIPSFFRRANGKCMVMLLSTWKVHGARRVTRKLRFSVFFFVQLLSFLGYGIERITVITSLSSWHIIITFYDPLFGFVVTFLFNVDSLQDFSPLYPTLVSRRKQVLGIQHVPLCKDYFHDTLF